MRQHCIPDKKREATLLGITKEKKTPKISEHLRLFLVLCLYLPYLTEQWGHLCISFPFFCLFTYGASSSCPEIWFRLKESEIVALQWFPESPGADTDDFAWVISVRYFSSSPYLWLLWLLFSFSAMPHWFSAIFMQGKRWFMVQSWSYVCFLLLSVRRLTSCSSGQEEGKLFLPFIAKKVGGLHEWI